VTDQASKARAAYDARCLPVEPLAAWLRENRPGRSATSLANEARIGDRTLRRILAGDQHRTSLAFADALLTGLGARLDDVWEPEERTDTCSLCHADVIRWRSAGGTVLVLDDEELTDHALTCPLGAIPVAVAA
jgi:hypothetical protein